ncbi:MAG: Hsp20/alpha crystallin family protein [bacterium]|nr:Hsp20/alpha crystallin family protein [bacterium]
MDLIPRSNFFFDDLFNDFLSYKDTNSFKCDIYEKENKYFIELDIPGFSKENTTIECDNGYLTVRISKKHEINDDDKKYIRRERMSKEYSRSFYVGNVDSSDIKANFKNGSLIIEIPKQEKIDNNKIIEIEEN